MIGFMVPGPVGGQGAETAALGCRVTLAPSADTDGDGLPDPMEAWLGTDYRDPDQDHDTMTDGWEVFHSLSPTNATGDDGPAADIDADGASNVQEYLADTDPRDETSCLRITAISRGSSTVLVTWKGGVNAWQRLESAVSLESTGETAWIAIYTNLPLTPVTSTVEIGSPTNGPRYFRIKAGR